MRTTPSGGGLGSGGQSVSWATLARAARPCWGFAPPTRKTISRTGSREVKLMRSDMIQAEGELHG